MTNRIVRIVVAIPFMCLALPIHYLAVTLEFVGYVLYRLLFYVIGDRACSFEDYMGKWWY